MSKILFTLIFLTFSTHSFSDQNSSELDVLFEDLYTVEDITQQNKIVSNIWSEWMKIDNPESQKIMDMVPYFFQTRNYDEAIEALSYVIEQEPNFSEAYNKRATFYFMMGDFDNSMKDIESTLALEPRHFGALDGMSRILISYKKYEQAFQVYEEMMSLMPNDVTLHMKIDQLNKLIYDDA
jgi:tetratricopeptide (TPR) repeat protein